MSELTGAELDKRMQEAGMIPLSELLRNNPMGRFSVHAGVVDLESFGLWLEMKREEYLKCQIMYQLNKNEDDEMFEWYMSHAAVFGEVLANFRAAIVASKEEV